VKAYRLKTHLTLHFRCHATSSLACRPCPTASRKASKENDKALKRAAQRNGMTVEELEASYWTDDAAARKTVDAILADRQCPPIEWEFGMNAQLMLMNMTPKKQ
jgi:hypothetical protein